MWITVSDKMQQRYRYEITEPMGEYFDISFVPELTPKEILELGVFGSKYLNDCQNEFPADWFETTKLSPNKYDINCNYFKVRASQPLKIWQQKGWFQWFCRYFMGRRHADDARQISRWRVIKRHVTQIKNHCFAGDDTCRPRQRQALLHWDYDSRRI